MSNDLQRLLVSRSIVTIEQVRLAEAAASGTDTTWLEQLLMWRYLDEGTIAQVAGAAVRAPACNLDHLAHLPKHVIAQLPRDLAMEHRVVPLSIESDGDLVVGMVNPCDVDAVQEIEFFLGKRVLREVAPATPLAWALSAYYAAAGPLWPVWDPATAVPRPSRLARGSIPPTLLDHALWT